MKREAVQPTKRGAMTAARRRRIWERDGGVCYKCRAPVPLKGTVMEHPTQLWMGGPDNDDDIHPICPTCDKPKTADDAAARGKVRRLLKREAGIKKPTTLRGRAFGDQHRPLGNRSLTRGFDGKVRPRNPARQPNPGGSKNG